MSGVRLKRKKVQRKKKGVVPIVIMGVLVALVVGALKMQKSAEFGVTGQPLVQKKSVLPEKTKRVEKSAEHNVPQPQPKADKPQIDDTPQPQPSIEETNEDDAQKPVTVTEIEPHVADESNQPDEPHSDSPEPPAALEEDASKQKAIPRENSVDTTTDAENTRNHSTPTEQPSPSDTPAKNSDPKSPGEQKEGRTDNSSSDFAEPPVLYGKDANTKAQQLVWRSWMNRMADQAKVNELVPKLETRLREVIPYVVSGDRLNYTSYRNSRLLMSAVELCYLTKLVEPVKLDDFLNREQLSGGEPKKSPKVFMKWLLFDRSRPLHQLLQAFVLNSGKTAEFPRTLKVFYELWKRAPERDRTRYMNLAIACSLVRSDAAHAPGMLRMSNVNLLSIPELYDYYRTQDIKNGLLTKIHKLDVTELLHVVDVRLPMSEFEWVKKELSFQRANWGEAYSSIEYMMERATQNVDPYKSYTFEEIQKEGGVCRDQAYFCSATAKTRGLPAVIIYGDGDRGPHAWVALYTSEKDGWTTTGSYGYKTGRFPDPCSGLMLHESALVGKNNKISPERQETAGNCMVLSDYLCRTNCKSEALGCARYVTQAYPQLTSSWRNYVRVMEQCGSESVNLTAWRRLYAELGHQMKKNMELMDLAQYVQANHVMEGKKDNVKLNLLKKSSRKLDELIQAGRVDLALESMERQAKLYADNADYRGLAGFFKGYFKDYGKQTNTFGLMLELYMRMIDHCAEKIEANEKLESKAKERMIHSMWRTCAKDAEGAFGKEVPDSSDFFAVRKWADVMHKIASCWRHGNDEKRAQSMEDLADKRYQEILDSSTDKKNGQRNQAKRRK